MLESYLNTVTSDKFLSEHLSAIAHVITFLSQGEYTRTSTELKRMVCVCMCVCMRVCGCVNIYVASHGVMF